MPQSGLGRVNGIDPSCGPIPGTSIGNIEIGAVELLPNSFNGSTYLARTSAGKIIVKYRQKYRPLAVTRSVTQLLSSRGVRVQRIAIPLTQTAGGWLLGLGWLDATPLSAAGLQGLSAGERYKLGEQLAVWLAMLHSIRPVVATDWQAKANSRFARKLEDAIALQALTRAETGLVKRRWDILQPCLQSVTQVLIHRDLHPANVLTHNGQLVTVIDFENARLADPLYDYVKIKDFLLPIDPDIARGFHQCYGTQAWTTSQAQRFLAVSMLEYLSAVVYHARRGEAAKVADRRQALLEAAC